jgi:hypothetical protein
MEIPKEHITAAVETFGYSEREGSFLWTVTAFSGHFLRAQWRQFAGVDSRGKADQQLIDRLLSNGHATGYAYRNVQLYHVTSKPLYRTFGRENSNHRRQPSAALITQRLGALDYVIAHQDSQYLLTEADLTRYFREEHGVSDAMVLPKRTYPARGSTRPPVDVFFPDRSPLQAAGKETVFTYIDAPADSFVPFRTHLRTYAPLFAALKDSWRFVFVSGKQHKLAEAERVFRETLAASAQPPDAMDPDLLRYFDLEMRVERKEFATLRKAHLEERARLKERYDAPKYRTLYEQWRRKGSSTLDPDTPKPPTDILIRCAAFVTFKAASLAL